MMIRCYRICSFLVWRLSKRDDSDRGDDYSPRPDSRFSASTVQWDRLIGDYKSCLINLNYIDPDEPFVYNSDISVVYYDWFGFT